MKATITFEIPEEQDAHKDALNGTAYRSILEALANACRDRYKYDGPGHFGSVFLSDILTHEGAVKLRDAIYAEANDEGVPLT